MDQTEATRPDDLSEILAATDTLLFDMDGVLLRGRGTDDVVHDRALDDALADRGLAADADTRSLLAGYEYDTDFALGCRRLGIDPIAFFDRRERHSADHTIDRLRAGKRTLFDDVVALAPLADRYALGVVSNNYDSVVRFVVDHFDLDAFSYLRGRDTGVAGFYQRKPDPHYLIEAADAMDVDEAIYVGDRPTDVVAATRAGLAGVFLRRSHNSDVTPPSETVSTIDSLAELPALTTQPSR